MYKQIIMHSEDTRVYKIFNNKERFQKTNNNAVQR